MSDGMDGGEQKGSEVAPMSGQKRQAGGRKEKLEEKKNY